MATPHTIADIIKMGDVCQYLWQVDNEKNKLFGGAAIDDRRPQMLYVETDVLRYVYTETPTATYIDSIADYVYTLCGKFAEKSYNIISGGAGGSVVSATSQTLTGFEPKSVEFVVGGVDALVANGGTVITIADSNIISGSIKLHVDGVELIKNQLDRFSYSVVYNANNAIITLLGGVAATGQAYQIEYNKSLLLSSGSSSATAPIYYQGTGLEGVTLTLSLLYGKNLNTVSKDGRGQFRVATNPQIGQFTFNSNTLDANSDLAGTIVFGGEIGQYEEIIISFI